jgi:hypothetical protein
MSATLLPLAHETLAKCMEMGMETRMDGGKVDSGLGNWMGSRPDEAPVETARGSGGATCLRPLG